MESLDHENIDSENSLFIIFNNVDGYIIEKSDADKYLIFASTKDNRNILRKYTELWEKIKNQIETIKSDKTIKYKKDFMKIRFYSNDNLLLGKILSIPSMVIVVKSVFQKDNNYYPQIHIHECG